jgi:hypothetical protein
MPELAIRLKPEFVVAGGAVLLLATVAAIAIWRYFRRRLTPEERERLRRLGINGKGKLGDCEIVDVEGALIVFSYVVAGVTYTASQDISALQTVLPQDAMSMIGPASVKFDPRNPANSIVICEDWTGLRPVKDK